jgi:hypothetical protein
MPSTSCRPVGTAATAINAEAVRLVRRRPIAHPTSAAPAGPAVARRNASTAIGSDETNGPFTFVTICDTLNLDPGYIREGLRRWRARPAGAASSRPRFRRDAIGTRHRVVVARPLRRIA